MRMGSFFTTGMLPGLIRPGRLVTVGGTVSALPPNKVAATPAFTVAELLGGFIRLTPTGAINIELPSAAAFFSYLPDLRVGDRIQCVLVNQAAGAFTVTVGAAAGGINFAPAATPTVAQGVRKVLDLLVTAKTPTPLIAAYM